MNNDLISREALKEDFECVGFNDYDDYNRALRIIDNAPTIEYTFEEAFQKTVCENKLYCPARPQGEWIEQTKYPYAYNCTNCGFENTHKANFCEKCGADMRKGGAE